MQHGNTTVLSREALIGWAAGLFEGEGSLFVHKRAGTSYLQVKAQLVSTDEDVVLEFRDIIGVGRIYGPYRAGKTTNKPFWRWDISGQRDTLALLDLIEPFLGVRRSAKAKEIRDFMLTLRPQSMGRCLYGHEFTEENTLYSKNGKYMKRRCRTCERNRARTRLRITSDRYRK